MLGMMMAKGKLRVKKKTILKRKRALRILRMKSLIVGKSQRILSKMAAR